MIPKNLLLAFQLENYMNMRFLRFIYTHPKFWIFWSKRQKVEYTSKARLILILAILLCIFDVGASIYFMSWIAEKLSIIAVIVFFPLYFVISNIIISPLDSFLKKRIITKATKKMQELHNLQVIAITGSYGKTTTKEILATILSESFHVLATQGTKNTPLWISRLILSELTENHKVFIVEMWAYEKWDIAELCSIVWPNISVLTGIALQHLERFKSLDNIIDAKFEILECLEPWDFAVVDNSTEWVRKGLNEKKLQVTNIKQVSNNIPYKYKENLSGMIFEIGGHEIHTKLLANYIGQTLSICYEISKYLHQDIKYFKAWCEKIDFVEHRMQLIHNKNSNVYVIDDSFNGNLEWIRSIFSLMEHAPFSGRKVLIAWGIVELGKETESVHLKLGRQISSLADLVLLVEWPVWNALKKWLSAAWYVASNIKMYKTPLELHEDLINITQSGDMIIFQNDLPDQYL